MGALLPGSCWNREESNATPLVRYKCFMKLGSSFFFFFHFFALRPISIRDVCVMLGHVEGVCCYRDATVCVCVCVWTFNELLSRFNVFVSFLLFILRSRSEEKLPARLNAVAF